MSERTKTILAAASCPFVLALAVVAITGLFLVLIASLARGKS
jgi:hypothetical protein